MNKAKNTTGQLEAISNKQPASKLKGILPEPAKAVSLEEMNKAIEEGALTSTQQNNN